MKTAPPSAPDMRPRVVVVVPLIIASLLACWVIVKLGRLREEDEAEALRRKTNVVEVSVNKRRVVRTNEILVPAPAPVLEGVTRPPASGPDYISSAPVVPGETNAPARRPVAISAKPAFPDVWGGAGGAANLGALRGTVQLTGEPPPEKELPMDPTCSALPSRAELIVGTRRTTSFYRVGTNSGLADVFVVLRGVEGHRYVATTNAPPLVIEQAGCLYTPYISAVLAGQRVVVTNRDPFIHNVNVEPKNAENRPLNLALMTRKTAELTLNNPELFMKFSCNIHPWMFAFVCVVEHPWFAVTDAEGRFHIPHIPPGRYTLEAHHRKAGIMRREVTVLAAHETELEMVLTAR